MVSFDDPPVDEVALAIAFEPLHGLTTVAIIDLWQHSFREAYPTVEEQAGPVRMAPEVFGPQAGAAGLTITPAMFEPNPRLWLMDARRGHLIQVQRDFFALNWRKENSMEPYPGFPRIRYDFEAAYGALSSFVSERGLGDLSVTQVEVSYINHISADGPAPISLPDVVTQVIRQDVAGLGEPEAQQYAANYVIGEQLGRLRVLAASATKGENQQSIIALNLTARGAPLSSTVEGVLDFMQFGSDVATEAFVGLTQPAMQHTWGRRDA